MKPQVSHQDHFAALEKKVATLRFNQLAQLLSGGNDRVDYQKLALIELGKRALAVENAELIFSHGLTDAAIRLLSSSDESIQELALKALINITIDEQSRDDVFDGGGIPPIVKLLDSSNETLQIHAAWALTNMTNNEANKQSVREADAIKYLLPMVESTNDAVQTGALKLLSNLSEEESNHASMTTSAFFVPMLKKLLTSRNQSVLMYILFIVRNLTKKDEGTQEIRNTHGLKILIHLLKNHQSPQILGPVLMIFANLAHKGDAMNIVNLGALPPLMNVLASTNARLVVFALTLLAELVAEKQCHKALLDGLEVSLVYKLLVRTDLEDKTKVTALRLLVELLSTGDVNFAAKFVETGGLRFAATILASHPLSTLQELALRTFVAVTKCEALIKRVLTDGAFPPIIAALTSKDPKVQERALQVSAQINLDATVRVAFAKSGALRTMLELSAVLTDPLRLCLCLRGLFNLLLEDELRLIVFKTRKLDHLDALLDSPNDKIRSEAEALEDLLYEDMEADMEEKDDVQAPATSTPPMSASLHSTNSSTSNLNQQTSASQTLPMTLHPTSKEKETLKEKAGATKATTTEPKKGDSTRTQKEDSQSSKDKKKRHTSSSSSSSSSSSRRNSRNRDGSSRKKHSSSSSSSDRRKRSNKSSSSSSTKKKESASVPLNIKIVTPEEDIKLLRVPSDIRWRDFRNKILHKCGREEETKEKEGEVSYSLKYKDSTGDLILLESQEDLDFALELFDNAEEKKGLQVYLQKRERKRTTTGPGAKDGSTDKSSRHPEEDVNVFSLGKKVSLQVFSYLDDVGDLLSVQQTCKTWFAFLAQEEGGSELWERLLARKMASAAEQPPATPSAVPSLASGLKKQSSAGTAGGVATLPQLEPSISFLKLTSTSEQDDSPAPTPRDLGNRTARGRSATGSASTTGQSSTASNAEPTGWKERFIKMQRNEDMMFQKFQPCRVLTGHSEQVSCVQLMDDERTVISGSFDRTLKVWDCNAASMLQSLNVHRDIVSCLRYVNGQLFSGSWDHTVKVWDFGSSTIDKCTQTLRHGGRVLCLHSSPSIQGLLVTGCMDKHIRVWDIARGEVLKEISVTEMDVLSLQADASKIISGGHKAVTIWDMETAKSRMFLEGHQGEINCLQSSASRIVSGSWDKTLRIWDPNTGENIKVLRGHTWPIRCLQFDEDQNLLVSGSADKTLKIWDFRMGECLNTLEGHTNFVSSLAFRGTNLISASDDCTLRHWDLVM
ncbi:Dynein assembly factor with WDR repeat domains 1 [Balamuthia mandrillaris]